MCAVRSTKHAVDAALLGRKITQDFEIFIRYQNYKNKLAVILLFALLVYFEEVVGTFLADTCFRHYFYWFFIKIRRILKFTYRKLG